MPLPKLPLLLVLLAVTAACSPRQSCIYRATGEFRTLEHDIRETREALRRGYRIERRSVPRTVFGICYARDPATMKPIPYTCRDTVFETETYRVPINRAREARNLAEYEAALPAARARAAAGTRQCEATYPEED
uniref:hypothetical protein n=1 Tax=Roseovarius indicus TaxID=540747 RepID=UPI003B52B08E